MKRFFAFLLLTSSLNIIPAEELDLLDIDKNDLDSVFDNPASEDIAPQESTQVIDNIRRRGFDVTASYIFQGVINPGWNKYPWENEPDERFLWALGFLMSSNLDINAQISEAFRVKSDFKVEIPNESGALLALGDFFFDYNFYDRVFLRAGKFEQGWGISPNYSFTNLLSRTPYKESDEESDPEIIDETPDLSGPSYIIKFDVPIGLGGLQLLAQTRVKIISGEDILKEYVGYGGKFNLAFRWADFNIGVFCQSGMATRGFLSIKTNIFDTDFYSEGLIAVNTHSNNALSYAYNIGFIKSFFNNKFDVNGELFFNGEGYTYFYSPETSFKKEDISPFPEGFNAALNLLLRVDKFMNMRIFTMFRYGEDSFSIIPGFRINPFSNIELYFAAPVALGSKEGIYYREAKDIYGKHRPVNFILLISIKGSVHASKYY